MKLGAESFTVYMYQDEDGEPNLQVDVVKASVQNVYEACFTICKMIENGEMQEQIGSDPSAN